MTIIQPKDWVQIIKDGMTSIGILLAGIYFLYRWLTGEFVPARLAIELICETPFIDKKLVRCILRIKNTGASSIRVREAWLWMIKPNIDLLPGNKKVDGPNWPKSGTSLNRPIEAPRDCVAYMDTYGLDFQRLSFDKDRLQGHQAKEKRLWLNLEASGEQQRQFLFNLPPGKYKAEFRIIGELMFGRRFSPMRWIRFAMFPLSRYSQWVATAAFAVEESLLNANQR